MNKLFRSIGKAIDAFSKEWKAESYDPIISVRQPYQTEHTKMRRSTALKAGYITE